mmetsp:Transcript_45782/g.68117  ORF Transcript_45782/g.68117 Transcript_45782/m.68117 type:complete len:453 (-) Transcript_45782:312-1670(-)
MICFSHKHQPRASWRQHHFFVLLFLLLPQQLWSLSMPPNQALLTNPDLLQGFQVDQSKIRVALLGCGMMGQEHISYMSGYKDLRIDFLCDPHQPSVDHSVKVMRDFYQDRGDEHPHEPLLLQEEEELLNHAEHIDLLVMAHPNYLHTPSLLKWGQYEHLTILVEKPVAVSQEQVDLLKAQSFNAKIWVAMEYRYIPAIAKLLEMKHDIGDIKKVTIRENRYPFLHKIGEWNRDRSKTGDTLVEKCCHFFDLFRLISGKEPNLPQIRALAQRGINYEEEDLSHYDNPILDSAYVTMPFRDGADDYNSRGSQTIGCLELCMFAEGSRHQEEIVVTGTKGRLEAYLPENKVYFFQRPDHKQWSDRSVPPPANSIRSEIHDCSNVKNVFGLEDDVEMPTHVGYHYSSTAVEWYHLLEAFENHKDHGETWKPHVTLNDGIRAVEMGLMATDRIVNDL